MSFWFWFFPLDFFFVRSSKIPSLLVTFWISSRKQLDDACRARRTTRGRRRLSSSEFLFCVLCRANADGGDRHVFCSVVVFIHARTHL